MIVLADIPQGRSAPLVSADVEAMVVWMYEDKRKQSDGTEVDLGAFVPGKSYWFKQATRLVTGSMVEIQHGVDVNTLAQRPASRLSLNEVGKVTLAFSKPLVFDPYNTNPATGAFIIVDRLSNNTVGAGMIISQHEVAGTSRGKARGKVSQEEKEIRLGQKGAVVWLSRTLAESLERALFEEARTVVHLDAADLQLASSGGNFAVVLRAFAEQGIIALIGSEGPPPESIQNQIGARSVFCPETDLNKAIAFLATHGILAAEESAGGEGI
jgi:bifunctional enzyme CysN/CysC